MARLDSKPVPGDWRVSGALGYTDEEKLEKTEYALHQLLLISESIDLTKTLVGVVVKFQVADGYAYYRVSKDRPLTLQHIPFCDAYQVHSATIRGLTRDDIVMIEKQQRQFAQIVANAHRLGSIIMGGS